MSHMLLIPVEGKIYYVDVPSDEIRRALVRCGDESLADIYVERVKVGADMAMAVDESGLIKELPKNPRATVLYGGDGQYPHPAFIAGDVLLGREGMVGGSPETYGIDWVDAPEEELRDWLASRIGNAAYATT